MRVSRRFTQEGQSPYAGVDFELRTSEIKNPDGSTVFRQEGIAVPAAWSAVAGARHRARRSRLRMVINHAMPFGSPNGTGSMLTASQARAARAMVRMTVLELARRAGVAPYTITRLEAGQALQTPTLEAVRSALEQAGAEFFENGVRLREN